MTHWIAARKFVFVGVLTGMLVGAGCVVRTEHTITAHITVDIRHIEKQADDVLDFIEGKSDTLPTAAAAPAPTSYLENFLRLIDPVPTAHAEATYSLSPLATQIAKRMQDRNGDVATLKSTGVIGENNRGYLELREGGSADADARNKAQQLMAEENKDRKALYNEIARSNKEANVTVSAVEAVYAQKRLMRGRTGEAYQLPPAGADFDEFKASAAGKALGDDAKPGAWVTLR